MLSNPYMRVECDALGCTASDLRKPLRLESPNGDVLEIDPYHDCGHAVLDIEGDPLDPELAGCFDLSPADIAQLGAWCLHHLAAHVTAEMEE